MKLVRDGVHTTVSLIPRTKMCRNVMPPRFFHALMDSNFEISFLAVGHADTQVLTIFGAISIVVSDESTSLSPVPNLGSA